MTRGGPGEGDQEMHRALWREMNRTPQVWPGTLAFTLLESIIFRWCQVLFKGCSCVFVAFSSARVPNQRPVRMGIAKEGRMQLLCRKVVGRRSRLLENRNVGEYVRFSVETP